jgi:hypothetical protein
MTDLGCVLSQRLGNQATRDKENSSERVLPNIFHPPGVVGEDQLALTALIDCNECIGFIDNIK